jgi:Domain of unknown function (DUF4124)
MRFILTLLLLGVAASATAAVYKWVQPDGAIIYSDRPPTKNAAPADLPNVQEITIAPTPPSSDESTPISSQDDQAVKYTNLEITEPANDSTIRDNAGNISIKLAIEPTLQEGDSIAILLDGKVIGQGHGTSISLSNVDRGTHTLTAIVKDAQNKTLISASSVTFHLMRTSVLHQTRPAAP